MMRNEDFSEGYFSGRLWAGAWEGNDEMFATDVKEAIDAAVLGTLDRRLWTEGFCYGAKAERRKQMVLAMSEAPEEDDEMPLTAEMPSSASYENPQLQRQAA